MTAPAIASPPCPVCGGQMYDNRATKKSPKQPDFKCKRYKEGCAGVIWRPKGPKPSNFVQPPYLQNQEAEDAAELAGKIGPADKPKLTKLYLDSAEFVLDKIVPLFVNADIPLSDTAVVAAIATLYISATKER